MPRILTLEGIRQVFGSADSSENAAYEEVKKKAEVSYVAKMVVTAALLGSALLFLKSRES